MKDKVIVIISGGMDSVTLLHDIFKNNDYDVYALSFDYNQRHKKELIYAKEQCYILGVNHKIIDLTQIGKELLQGSSLTSDNIDTPHGNYDEESMKLTVVPFRNQLFLTLACSYAESIKAKTIFYGAHSGDHFIYWDCLPSFINKFNELVLLNDMHKIKVLAPYSNYDKGTIVKIGLDLNIDYSKTWTCYEGKENACGECGSCRERLEAFAKNNVKDPLIYDSDNNN